MKPSTAVVFTKTNAHVISDIIDTGPYIADKNSVVCPDLSAVKDVDSEFWKLENGCILPMNQAERNIRKIEIEHFKKTADERHKSDLKMVSQMNEHLKMQINKRIAALYVKPKFDSRWLMLPMSLYILYTFIK